MEQPHLVQRKESDALGTGDQSPPLPTLAGVNGRK